MVFRLSKRGIWARVRHDKDGGGGNWEEEEEIVMSIKKKKQKIKT